MNRKEEDSIVMAKLWAVVGTVALVLTAILMAVSVVANVTGPAYEFQDKVHSHMENAYWGSTPELMKTELNLSMQGMRELGLVEGMNAKIMPWKQTPDWSMDYQFAHIQAIIERCEEVIAWRDAQDLSSGQVTDVYAQKMENLKAFIVEDTWSDDIAYAAWYANFNVYYVLWYYIFAAVGVMATVFCFGKALVHVFSDSYDDFEKWAVRLIALAVYIAVIWGTVAHTLSV